MFFPASDGGKFQAIFLLYFFRIISKGLSSMWKSVSPVVFALFTVAGMLHAQTPPPCEPLRYFNPAGQELVYTESMPTVWWAVRMSTPEKTDVDSAFIAFGVDRATTSGTTPDTLDIRILKDQLPQQIILDQLSILIPPNLQGKVPDAYYLVELQIASPTAQINPGPADFWLSWLLRGPAGDQARIRLKNPALYPRRSVSIGPSGDTTIATLVVKTQLGLARQDSVDLWAEVRGCFPDRIPVELTSFTAVLRDGTALLEWRTATEENNRGFYIERLVPTEADARVWQQIGFVDGHGSTHLPQQYMFVDPTPALAADAEGVVRYRLHQVDYDGSSESSPVVELHVQVDRVFALQQNHPNPVSVARGRAVVDFQLPEEANIRLALYDALGRELRTIAEGRYAAGSHSMEVGLQGLTAGVYFYRLTSGDRMQLRRMIVTE